MANIIKPKRSNTAGNTPTTSNLASGELGVNMADQKTYINNGTAVVQIGAGNLSGLGDVSLTSPTAGQSLSYNGTNWVNSSAGAGDVVGPASATDNALARFDSTTGKILQNGVITQDDNGTLASVNAIGMDTTPTSAPTSQGSMYWDTDYNTLSVQMDTATHAHVGQSEFFYAKASSTITKGQLCYFTGAVGASGVIQVAPAISGITNPQYIIGIASEDIATNGFGYIQTFGVLKGFDTSAYAVGTILYYDSTNGGLTSTYPTSGIIVTVCAVVTQSAGAGAVAIRPTITQRITQSTGITVTQTSSGSSIANSGVTSAVAGTGISVSSATGAVTISNTGVTSVGATSPIASSGGATPTISISQATTSTNGYLSSTDWNTFNNKQPAGSYLTTVTASSPLSGSGTSGSPLVIAQSTTSTSGYLSSTDWNTFNNKQAALVSGTNIKTVNGTTLLGSGDVSVGVTSVTGTAPISSSGGATPAISLASGYGDTQNPYASKTANYFLAAPNGLAGAPTFRAMVAADVPTLNQNTTGSAATLTTGRTIAITGDLTYTSPSFNGSANVTAAGTLATVNSNVGTYTKITINAKGLATAGSQASLSDLSSPTSSFSMGSQNLTSVLDPVNAQDAATKNYVDTVAQGLDAKGSCVCATTANITLSGTQTIDGVAVVANDRVLVKNQTAPAENGIYVASAAAWTRATDMNTWAEVPNAFTFIEGGSTQADTGWVCTSAQGGTLGTTAITWTQFSGAGTYTAGTGLTLTGTQFSITNTGTAGTYGSSTLIPVITTNAQGQVTGVTTASNPQGTVTSVSALTIGTTGTDLSSTVATGTTTPVITLNVPTASATNRGALSSTDWSTFNGKWSSGTALSATTGSFSGVITSTLASGTAPFTIASTTLNTNLNADLLDGQHGSYYQPASTAITTSNIGSQSVNYATSAGSATSATSATTATTANALNSSNSYSLQSLNTNTWYTYNDNDRNAGSATYYPNASTRSVRYFFATASSAGTGGNYAGVMQFNPWDGNTSSTGDASYQFAFGSTATNGGGIPQLNIRKGIDTTWNSWYTLLHSGNYNSYSPTLTGSGASGSWGISVTGSSASCTGNAATATTASSCSGNSATATTASGLSSGVIAGKQTIDTFTATASQTIFTTSATYTSGKINVYANGVRMRNGTDVTVTSGTSVVFASGLAVGTLVDIEYFV